MTTTVTNLQEFKKNLGEKIKGIENLPWSEEFKKSTKRALLKEMVDNAEYKKLRKEFLDEKRLKREYENMNAEQAKEFVKLLKEKYYWEKKNELNKLLLAIPDIKIFNTKQVGDVLEYKYTYSSYFAGHWSSDEVRSFKVAGSNIYLITKQSFRSDSSHSSQNRLIILDNNLRELYRVQQNISSEREARFARDGGWYPASKWDNKENKFLSILSVENHKIKVMNGDHKEIYLDVPQNIPIEDYEFEETKSHS